MFRGTLMLFMVCGCCFGSTTGQKRGREISDKGHLLFGTKAFVAEAVVVVVKVSVGSWQWFVS